MANNAHAVVWWDFDDMPVTSLNGIPGESADWKYSSVDNPVMSPGGAMTFFGSAGFVNKTNYGTLQPESLSVYASGYNDPHMGYWGFGYLDIVDDFCMSGKCLRYTTTGGHSKANDGTNHCGALGSGTASCDAYGVVYRTKEQWLALQGAGINPNYDKSKGDYNLGRFKFYLGNNDNTYRTPMPAVPATTNRMSYYVHNPKGIDPRNVPKDNVAPGETAYPGPANHVGGHWYHLGTITMGGGWTHYYVDEHPNYNNSWGSPTNSPIPLGAMRTFRAQYPSEGSYWASMYTMYHSAAPADNQPIEFNGATRTFPDAFHLDKIEFVTDSEPQNEETINGMALTYTPENTSFWLGFFGKYHLGGVDYATYEVRYRIGSEITNDNWATSTLADIIPIPEFKMLYPAPGVVAKNYPSRAGVMIRFRVQTSDQGSVYPGANLWVAVKEVGQDGSNPQLPSTIPNYKGKNYTVNTLLDWTYDEAALPLIKRIPYTVGPFISTANPVCDNLHRSLCTVDDCSGAGGYWYNSTCNATPPPSTGIHFGAGGNIEITPAVTGGIEVRVVQ